jgi:hypothetical protein
MVAVEIVTFCLGFFGLGPLIVRYLNRPKRKEPTLQQHVEKTLAQNREKDPLYAVQNPETEELRAIYRQLDEELMLDEEVRTPPEPVEVRFAADQAEVNRRTRVIDVYRANYNRGGD